MSASRLLPSAALALLLAACHPQQAAAPVPHTVVFDHPQPLASGGAEVFPAAVRARVETDLAFRIAGKIARREVNAGSRVAAGQVLATLDPQDAQLNVEAARTAQQAARADRDLAATELRRYRDLQRRGFVAQSAVDARDSQAKVAEARLAEASARLSLVENQSGYTALRADGPGVVTAILAEAGQVVAAGQPVLRFAADGEREAVISVPETRYEALKAAATLRVSLWSKPDKLYPGRLREISPQADPGTRTHEARITIVDADADVQLGATASVYVGDAASADRFQLPLTALAGTREQPLVWVVDGERVKRVPVTIAAYLPDAAVVSGALGASDRVVSAGAHLLVDGETVRAVPRTRAAAAQ